MEKGKGISKRKVVCIVGMVAVLAVVCIRYAYMNIKYPSPVIETFSQGETLELANYSFKLTEWKWGNGENAEKLLPGYALMSIDGEKYPNEKERIGLATVTIEKQAEDNTYLDLTNITFESGAWGNQWDHTFMMGINEKLDSLRLDMKVGESIDVIFPIVMWDFQFPKQEWEKIDKRDFYIVIQYYPVKYRLLCENEERE